MGLLDDWSDGWLGLLHNAAQNQNWDGGIGTDAANYPRPFLVPQPQRAALGFGAPGLKTNVAASSPNAPAAPLAWVPRTGPATPAQPDWPAAGDRSHAGLPYLGQAQASTGNPFAAYPDGPRAVPTLQSADSQGTAPSPTPTAQNLTAHTLRTKGVPETDIAAAIGNPELMRWLINRNFGPGSAEAPAKTGYVDDGPLGFNSPNQAQASISGARTTSATAQPENSKPPTGDTPVHLAQLFALPPVSIFARPPVYIPRELTPLEDLPQGSAGGPRAGMDFLRNEGKPKTPEEYPRCTYCGEKTGPGNFHRDHIIPRSRGGNGSEDNRAPACARCNLSKGAKTPEEWYTWMKNGGV
jgi:HNH endonuclease